MALKYLKAKDLDGLNSDFMLELPNRINLHQPTSAANSKGLLQAFRLIFVQSTAQVAVSKGVVEVCIDNSEDSKGERPILGFKEDQVLIRRDLTRPSVVEIIQGDESVSRKYKVFRYFLEICGVYQPFSSILSAREVNRVSKLSPVSFWKFLQDEILLVSKTRAFQENVYEDYRKEYFGITSQNMQREDLEPKVALLEEQLESLSVVRETQKEIEILKFHLNEALRHELSSKIGRISKLVEHIDSEIDSKNKALQALVSKVRESDVLEESASHIVQNLGFFVQKLEENLMNADFSAIFALQIENSVVTEPSNWFTLYEKVLRDRQKVAKASFERLQLIENCKSKINFFNLLLLDGEEAVIYRDSLQKTLKTQEENAISAEEELKKAQADLDELKEELSEEQAAFLKVLFDWKGGASKAGKAILRLVARFEDVCSKITENTKNQASLEYELGRRKVTLSELKSKLKSLGESSVEGLVELEKFLLSCEDAGIKRKVVRPMYQCLEFKDDPNPMRSDFASLLPVILVKSLETAQEVLDKLPKQHEYTFLVQENFRPEKSVTLFRLSQHRDLRWPLEFLSKKVKKNVSELIKNILKDHAVLRCPSSLEDLVELQKMIQITLNSPDGDQVSRRGVIRGGYQAKEALDVKDLIDYVAARLENEKVQKKLAVLGEQSGAAWRDFEVIRKEMHYLLHAFELPIQINEFHGTWRDLIDAKLRCVDSQDRFDRMRSRAQSTEKLIREFSKFIDDRENQPGAPTIPELYAEIKKLEAAEGGQGKLLKNIRSQEKSRFSGLLKAIDDLKSFEETLVQTKHFNLLQVWEPFRESAKEARDKFNEAIQSSIRAVFETKKSFEQKRLRKEVDEMAIESEEENLKSLGLMRRNAIEQMLKPLKNRLEEVKCVQVPLRNHKFRQLAKDCRSFDAVSKKLAEAYELLKSMNVPFAANVQSHEESTQLERYRSLMNPSNPISSPFLDNVLLVFEKMHFRDLRRILSVFEHAKDILQWQDVSVRIGVKRGEETHHFAMLEDIERLEVVSQVVPRPQVALVFLISVAVAMGKPFVVLHDFLQYFEEDQVHDFFCFLKQMSAHIQVICIDEKITARMSMQRSRLVDRMSSFSGVGSPF